MFHDCWLLNFDLYGDCEWKWTQLKVRNWLESGKGGIFSLYLSIQYLLKLLL